jgi:DUF1009 family protein
VVAVAHRGETDPSLAAKVSQLHWVRVGQLGRIKRVLRAAGVERAVMAGGIGRVRALRDLRPDWGAVRMMARLGSFRDDALLRGIARFFEEGGVAIEAPTDWVREVLAPLGHLAGPALSQKEQADVALGIEVAMQLGKADVGQTVVIKGGHVLALEAVEGTDEAIRRGASFGGKGAVVVKLCKPGQDERFDLPAVGADTIGTLRACGARVLAIEAGRTLMLDAAALFACAEGAGISVIGVARDGHSAVGSKADG